MNRLLGAMLASFLLCACPCDPSGTPEPDAGIDIGPDTSARICPETTCHPDTAGRLTVGTGIPDAETGIVWYAPITPGAEVTIEPGWQGGQHIWVLLRAEDVQTCFVEPRYYLLDESGEPLLDWRYGGNFYPLPDDPQTYEFLAFAAFIADPEPIHRRALTLVVEVSDGCGNLMSDAVEIVPVDHRLD